MKVEKGLFVSDRVKLNILDLLWLMLGGEVEMCGIRIQGHVLPCPECHQAQAGRRSETSE